MKDRVNLYVFRILTSLLTRHGVAHTVPAAGSPRRDPTIGLYALSPIHTFSLYINLLPYRLETCGEDRDCGKRSPDRALAASKITINKLKSTAGYTGREGKKISLMKIHISKTSRAADTTIMAKKNNFNTLLERL